MTKLFPLSIALSSMVFMLSMAPASDKATTKASINVPPKGFKAIFNGKDFTGLVLNPRAKEYWKIEEGVLKAPKLLDTWGADLQTKASYKDFELLVDFRMPTNTDSGIYFRKLLTKIKYWSSEQLNIGNGQRMGELDSINFYMRDKKCDQEKLTKHGLPKINRLNPEVGQWHTLRLTVIGRTVSAKLNGKVLIDKYEYPEWYLCTEAAPIRFQKHRFLTINGKKNPCPIEFRNIFIREIK